MTALSNYEIDDAGDRARSYSKGGPVRIQLEEISFWHGNRGNSGVIGYHVHRIAQYILKHGTKLHRYNHVGIVGIPKNRLTEILEINRARCKTDRFLPRFSDRLKYVCLYKTHFTHAQKLIKDGGRTMFNRGRIPLYFRVGDNEGPQIS